MSDDNITLAERTSFTTSWGSELTVLEDDTKQRTEHFKRSAEIITLWIMGSAAKLGLTFLTLRM